MIDKRNKDNICDICMSLKGENQNYFGLKEINQFYQVEFISDLEWTKDKSLVRSNFKHENIDRLKFDLYINSVSPISCKRP